MDRKIIVILTAVAVVFIVVVGGMFWWMKKIETAVKNPTVLNDSQVKNSLPPNQAQSSQPVVAPSAKNSNDGLVEWYPAPKSIPAPKLFSEKEDRVYKAWEVGKFVSGENKDEPVVLIMGASVDPGGPDIWRFAKGVTEDNKQLKLLSRYSLNDSSISEDFVDMNVVDPNASDSLRINSLEYPGVLYTPKGEKMELENDFPYEAIWNEKTNAYNEDIMFKNDLLKKAFTDPVYGDFYTTDFSRINDQNADSIYAKNGFYVKAPDGTFRIYSLDIDFIDNNDVPNVVWDSGTKNTLKYTYQGEKGCGVGMFALVVNDKFQLSDLAETGKTATGSPVYELKDKNSKFIKDYYDALKNMDDSFFEGKNFEKDITYDQFLAAHPIFFWKDPFGRLILFLSTDYINTESPGCGKPVIYLYPEKTENISVNVMPTGGMTKSEPDYGSGWNVIADPLSQIKNMADGKTYPYLFWEGKSNSIYQMSNYGFVVERDNLESLLNEKLTLLGLNDKEIGDFKEYWLPKMLAENKPYYFVTFVPRQKIDEIAPLKINPQPDTTIRVLMDYKGLDEKINAPGYDIKTPERKGFTAVEWGGMLK